MEKSDNENRNGSDILVKRLEVVWKCIQQLKTERNNSEDQSDKQSSPLVPMMEALPHLHFPEGTLLDFYQYGSYFGSQPVFYVRKVTDARIPHFSKEATADDPNSDVVGVLDAVSPAFMPEGMWELILLLDFGEQFGLVWHANYSQRVVVYDMQDFLSDKYFGEKISGMLYGFPPRSPELLSWQTAPKVTMQENSALVEYCMFSPFGGFAMIQRTVMFEREPVPNAKLARLSSLPRFRCPKLQKPVVVKEFKYNCGICF